MATASPTSQFAVLLRRSKFASYDPKIGQVYTSYGGHIHRGNWGFKRPLPIRRRNAHIMVNAVDSKEEQTEWKAVDKEGQFMRMWDEAGVTPTVDPQGPWATKLGTKGQAVWALDTEFADASEAHLEASATSQAESATYGAVSAAVPNINAMSDKEFKRYLETLRQSRPAFISYLKEITPKRAQVNPNGPTEFTSAWDSSSRPLRDHTMFLGSQAYRTYNSPDSRTIEQQPQTFAGLSYAKSPVLQEHLLHKAQPGHVTIKSPPAVSFAGLHADSAPSSGATIPQVNFTELANTGHRNRQEGSAKFKLKAASLNQAPQVVGKVPQRLVSSNLDTSVVLEGASTMQRTNTHPPGSPEYVAHNPQKLNPSTILSARQPKANVPAAKNVDDKGVIKSSHVLSTLTGMLAKRNANTANAKER